jgi:hypothetical protein
MVEVLGKVRAVGTALLAAAVLSLIGEASAKAPKPPATAPAPQLRPDEPLDEKLTSEQPPLPRPRPNGDPSPGDIGSPAPDTHEQATLSEGLTSTEPPVPTRRPAALSPRFIGPPVPDLNRETMLDEGLTSEEAPIPEHRPGTRQRADVAGPPAVPTPPPPRPAVPPETMAQCIAELQSRGADFTRQAPITDPAGCAVQNPVALRSLGNGMKVMPEALLDCPMALAAVRFMTEVAVPEASRDFGSELVSINNASGYVCRPRHGETKLSEHAYGNALDVAGFALADGRHIDVRGDAPEAEAKFLDAVRKAACGPFKTVLGPGSDADHALHFHFDLEPRRNGSTFCQ